MKEILPFSYAEYANFLTLNSQKLNNTNDDKDKFPELLKNESFGNLANPLKLTKNESFADCIFKLSANGKHYIIAKSISFAASKLYNFIEFRC